MILSLRGLTRAYHEGEEYYGTQDSDFPDLLYPDTAAYQEPDYGEGFEEDIIVLLQTSRTIRAEGLDVLSRRVTFQVLHSSDIPALFGKHLQEDQHAVAGATSTHFKSITSLNPRNVRLKLFHEPDVWLTRPGEARKHHPLSSTDRFIYADRVLQSLSRKWRDILKRSLPVMNSDTLVVDFAYGMKGEYIHYEDRKCDMAALLQVVQRARGHKSTKQPKIEYAGSTGEMIAYLEYYRICSEAEPDDTDFRSQFD